MTQQQGRPIARLRPVATARRNEDAPGVEIDVLDVEAGEFSGAETDVTGEREYRFVAVLQIRRAGVGETPVAELLGLLGIQLIRIPVISYTAGCTFVQIFATTGRRILSKWYSRQCITRLERWVRCNAPDGRGTVKYRRGTVSLRRVSVVACTKCYLFIQYCLRRMSGAVKASDEGTRAGSRRWEKVRAVAVIGVLLAGAILISASFGGALAQKSGATEISDWNDLDEVREDPGGDYVLVNDLGQDTAGYEEVAGPDANGGSGFDPIGSFTGSFDGQGHTIGGLVISRPVESDVGLFEIFSGTIENVTLDNATVTGSTNVGGLVGTNDQGSVRNVFVGGSVTGSERVGGLGGQNFRGTVTESSASSDVDGSSEVGGLVGDNAATVSNASARGDVTGSSLVGGLVGNNTATVTDSTASGAVGGSSFNIGGLVGANVEGTVTDSEASGAVSGSRFVGGLVGNNFEGTVTESSGGGDVTGSSLVGGLVGVNVNAVVSNSTADATVSGESEQIGGLVGRSESGSIVRNSTASGGVSGGSFLVAGLVGSNVNSDIIDSASSASVEATSSDTAEFNESIAGLAGFNSGTVTDSSATGQVTAPDLGEVAGLVGDNRGTVTASKASGDVTGSSAVGGLVGISLEGTVSESFATGAVTGSSAVGGLVGQLGFDDLEPGEEAILRDSYYDSRTTGQRTAVGDAEPGNGIAETRGEVAGPTTSEMQGASAARTMSAFDFENTWRIVTSPDDYPELRSLTEADPVAEYTNEAGVVETDGLREAISDWRTGEIDTGLLRETIDAWRTGEPVT